MFFHCLLIVIQKTWENFEAVFCHLIPFSMYKHRSIFSRKHWCPPDTYILVCLCPCFVHQKCIKPHRNEWPCTMQCLFRFGTLPRMSLLWSKPYGPEGQQGEIKGWEQLFCASFEHSLHPDPNHELFISAMTLYWMSLAWFRQNAVMCCNWITEAASHPRRKVKVGRLCHLHGNCVV